MRRDMTARHELQHREYFKDYVPHSFHTAAPLKFSASSCLRRLCSVRSAYLCKLELRMAKLPSYFCSPELIEQMMLRSLRVLWKLSILTETTAGSGQGRAAILEVLGQTELNLEATTSVQANEQSQRASLKMQCSLLAVLDPDDLSERSMYHVVTQEMCIGTSSSL